MKQNYIKHLFYTQVAPRMTLLVDSLFCTTYFRNASVYRRGLRKTQMTTATTMMITINSTRPPATDIPTMNVMFDSSPTHMSIDNELSDHGSHTRSVE